MSMHVQIKNKEKVYRKTQ